MHRRTSENDDGIPLGQPKVESDTDRHFNDGVVSISHHGFRLCFRDVYVWHRVLARAHAKCVDSSGHHRATGCSMVLPAETDKRV